MKHWPSKDFYQAAFPGVGQNTRFGSVTESDAMQTIARYIAVNYQNSRCAYFFGSAARGEFKEWSDVDVLIVVSELKCPEKRFVVFEGLMLDLQIYNLDQLSVALKPNRNWPTGPIARCVLSGRHVYGEKAIAERIESLARQYQKNRLPLDQKSQAVKCARVRATTLMVEITTNKERDEAVCCAVHLYDLLTRMVVLQITGQMHEPKWARRIISQYDLHWATHFHESFVRFVSCGDESEFLRNCEYALDLIGGAFWHGAVLQIP